jgi:hypothetical protein
MRLVADSQLPERIMPWFIAATLILLIVLCMAYMLSESAADWVRLAHKRRDSDPQE